MRIMLKDVFGFSEHQEKATFGLGFKLTLSRNTVNSVLKKDNATNGGKTEINSIELYVPQYIPAFHNKIYYLNWFQVRYLQSFIV